MFVIALLPILWLVLAMCVLKMSAWKACSLALVISLIVAIPVFGMVPLDAATAVLEGIALACWPILLVVIATIFTYNLAVGTRAMETIKQLLTSVSSDKRVLALLIGWGFGGFMEGILRGSADYSRTNRCINRKVTGSVSQLTQISIYIRLG